MGKGPKARSGAARKDDRNKSCRHRAEFCARVEAGSVGLACSSHENSLKTTRGFARKNIFLNPVVWEVFVAARRRAMALRVGCDLGDWGGFSARFTLRDVLRTRDELERGGRLDAAPSGASRHRSCNLLSANRHPALPAAAMRRLSGGFVRIGELLPSLFSAWRRNLGMRSQAGRSRRSKDRFVAKSRRGRSVDR